MENRVVCFVQIYKPMNPMKRQIYSHFREDNVTVNREYQQYKSLCL